MTDFATQGSSEKMSTAAGSEPSVKTLAEHAADVLRERILAGDYRAGQRIPLERVSQDLGMSPSPVREALRTMVSMGLVVSLPRRGYVVASVRLDELDDIYRLRLELEPLAVRLAVPLLTEADLARLDRDLVHLDEAFEQGNWQEHRQHHHRFHFGIYGRCNSPWLMRFSEILWMNSERYQRLSALISGGLFHRAAEHHEILGACVRGASAEASELMRSHLASAAATIRDYLKENRHLLEPTRNSEEGDMGDLSVAASQPTKEGYEHQ